MANGYNPLRWDCEKKGCFNIKRRPKIEVFAECFPGNINFGDVDGIVEINGRALILEWKTDTEDPTRGQHIMYTRLTRGQMISVMLIVGNAETMEVTHRDTYIDGKKSPLEKASLESVKADITRWRQWAQRQPRPKVI